MIKRITDTSFESWHEQKVSDEVEKLQEEGYEVVRVRRDDRVFLGFGTNITTIYYHK